MTMAPPSSATSWTASCPASWTISPRYRPACSFPDIGGLPVGVSLGAGAGGSPLTGGVSFGALLRLRPRDRHLRPDELRFNDLTPHWMVGGRSGAGKTAFLIN